MRSVSFGDRVVGGTAPASHTDCASWVHGLSSKRSPPGFCPARGPCSSNLAGTPPDPVLPPETSPPDSFRVNSEPEEWHKMREPAFGNLVLINVAYTKAEGY